MDDNQKTTNVAGNYESEGEDEPDLSLLYDADSEDSVESSHSYADSGDNIERTTVQEHIEEAYDEENRSGGAEGEKTGTFGMERGEQDDLSFISLITSEDCKRLYEELYYNDSFSGHFSGEFTEKIIFDERSALATIRFRLRRMLFCICNGNVAFETITCDNCSVNHDRRDASKLCKDCEKKDLFRCLNVVEYVMLMVHMDQLRKNSNLFINFSPITVSSEDCETDTLPSGDCHVNRSYSDNITVPPTFFPHGNPSDHHQSLDDQCSLQ